MLIDPYCLNLFCAKIRIKITCRNPSKIPPKRLFDMNKKLYLVNNLVEGFDQMNECKPGKDEDDD
jgi:hypothetical protein